MDSIYFEKQEGSLCAQHCLNSLLQGPYFTAVDLAMHAQNLDDEEKLRMAECGVDSDEYTTFLQQPSGNMDDSGYFSVQVISSCLSVWGLELVRYGISEGIAKEAKQIPESMRAYICNYKEHWFTVRKLATQWFNLNSCCSGPKLISDTYLGLFLAQLQQEGYSIFVVLGDFPQCEADEVLKTHPVVANVDTKTSSQSNADTMAPKFPGKGYRLGGGETPHSRQDSADDETDELKRALKLSLAAEKSADNGEDEELRAAIALSLRSPSFESVSSGGTSSLSKPSSLESESARTPLSTEDERNLKRLK